MANSSNKTAAISGASKGIGKQIALNLARKGWNLVLNSRSEFLPGELASYYEEGKVCHIRGDISDPLVTQSIVKRAVDTYGGLTCAILNAGIGYFGPFLDTPVELADKIVNTNIRGSILFAKSTIPVLIRNSSSNLIFISSTAGFRGGANEAVYASTKHAQVGLAGSLDREFREAGLKVTVIAPGATETSFALGNGRDATEIQEFGYLDPNEVAEAVSYVLSVNSSSRIQLLSLLPMTQQS
jgi:short-subunit dehydrogenase